MQTTGVRIPLQLGHSAVLGRLRASSLFLPSLVLLFAWVAVPGWVGDVVDDDPLGWLATAVAFAVGFAIGVLAIVGMAFASSGGDDAERQAPSDLVLGDVVRVRGGPHDGVRLSWAEVRAAEVVRDPKSDAGAVLRFASTLLRLLRLRALADRFRADVWQLRVGERVLGEAVRDDEVESLRLLADTLVGIARARAEPPVQVTHASDVLSCTSCGGAATPADRETVQCRFCEAQVEIPTELRERIRAHARARGGARLERTIRRLLDQPDAIGARKLLRVGAVLMRFAWPLGLAAFVTLVLFHVREQDTAPRIFLADGEPFPLGRDLGLGLALVAAVFVAVPVALDAWFANRRALRLLTLDFGATPPARPGAGWGCRVCAGPLPESDRILVRCVYCDADNVAGIDLRMQASRAQEHARSVAAALRHRRRARLRFAVVVVVLAGGLGWLGRELVWTAEVARPRQPRDMGCGLCMTAAVDNEDGVRHRVEVVAGEERRVRVLPAGARVYVECQYECEIRMAGQSYPLRKPALLSIRGGWLELTTPP